MADQSETTSMDFCAFVREFNQSTHDSTNSSWNCCPPESRLSQDFENKMQLLLSNYDLNHENDIVVNVPVVQSEHGKLECDEPDQLTIDNAFSTSTVCPDDSLETTIDNEDDPLELTGEEECDDSGDAGDGWCSDEQQQSKSLSLSYSLSISHAQENFSQYSQSTDKGLSKRYDSPCSYEDDRESECTNFDKLDDWNDFINDMHNNNNNADNGNKDFKEYYDEYLASKNIQGNEDEDDPTEECSTKEAINIADKTLDSDPKNYWLNSAEESWDHHPDTPATSKHRSIVEKDRLFIQYRNPNVIEDDSMDIEGNTTVVDQIKRVPSCKRKFHYDDQDDYEYEESKFVTEKFLKTEEVPFYGCHVSISQIDDELFAKLVRIESYDTTSASASTSGHDNTKPTVSESYDDERDENESTNATTPTNSGSLEEMIQVFENNAYVEEVECQRNTKKSK